MEYDKFSAKTERSDVANDEKILLSNEWAILYDRKGGYEIVTKDKIRLAIFLKTSSWFPSLDWDSKKIATECFLSL